MATKIPIALQMYSVRKEAAADPAGVLQAVAKMGYAGVEFAGYYGKSAKELRTILDDLGLKCCGTHLGVDELLGDKLAATVDFNQTLGNPHLVVAWMPKERTGSPELWKQTAALYNDIAAKLAPLGMQVGYHNHNTEFRPFPTGDLPWDLFFANTRREVIMQMDTGNALDGGGDVVSLLARYPGRATTVHLKEYSKSNPKALIGEGDVPWAQVFQHCETAGNTKWYIVEQESSAFPPMQCVDLCLQKLRAMGK